MNQNKTNIWLIIIASIYLFPQCQSEIKEKEIKIFPLEEKWEMVVPNQIVPEGLISLKAKDCIICHQDHYNEWLQSTHAHAWTDMQFQAEIKKDDSPFFCINCHIPLQNQQEYIIQGKEENDIFRPVKIINPNYDHELQLEGITCAVCHVRDGAIVGTKGYPNTPHKTIIDQDFLSESLCIQCHTANAVVTKTVVCSFETGDEWKLGPYSETKNCIACHMEEKSRSIVQGLPKRTTHFHAFPGSGIPKVDSILTNSLEGLEISTDKVKSSYSLDSIEFSISLQNKFAGHNLPTGDPERFYLITISILNENDSIINQLEDRIGEKWEWYPEAKKVFDNNLHPLESRDYTLKFLPIQKGKYKVHFNITKHRMNNESAEYNKLPESYPLFIQLFEREFTFRVK